ncbi:MAG: asparagine synthetase B [Methanocella sp. PtaU1.Bin125]|nr:MAG: asparagine synthetase B [Methanocella sp. PtaU1.Bin125]
MCGIAGFAGKEAWQRTCEMTGLLHHRGPDGSAVYDGKTACLGHTHLKVTGDYPQPALSGGSVFVFNGEIYNYRDFADVTSDTEALARILSGGMESLVSAAPYINGDYSLGLWDGSKLALLRDPVGVKPLYYGRSSDGFGFASERKALWKAGIRDVKALSPGAMLADGEERRVVDLPRYEPVLDEEKAIGTLDVSLAAAVRARVHASAAVTFSGGIDSALIGALAPGMPLVTVGLEGSHDIKAARHAVRLMGVESRHVVYEIGENDVEAAVAGTVYAVESADPLKVSIALPLYILAQKARDDGYRVLLSGQGADELFGGYARYERAFDEGRLPEALDHDLRHIAEVNLERDDAATMAHGVELRVPFLDMRVIAAARRMGPSLKVRRNGKDYIRKYVLRKVAEKYLPPEVAAAPKKAIQYGTGVQKTLERLARSRGSAPAGYLESQYRKVFR